MNRGHATTARHPQPARPSSPAALVAGGTGALGAGVVHALLRAGARVLVPSRSGARLGVLRAACAGTEGGRLSGVEADLATLQGAEAVRARVDAEYGNLDMLVAAFGDGTRAGGAARDLPASYRPVLNEVLIAHFVTAATLLPRLAPGAGSYTVLCSSSLGAGPDGADDPLTVAGLLMMAREFRRDARATGVRVNVVTAAPGVGAWPDRAGGPGSARAACDCLGELVAALAAPPCPVDGEVVRVDDVRSLRATLARLRGAGAGAGSRARTGASVRTSGTHARRRAG